MHAMHSIESVWRLSHNQSEIRNFTPHLAPSSTPPTTLVMTVPTKPPTPDTAPPTAPRSPDLECRGRAEQRSKKYHKQFEATHTANCTKCFCKKYFSLRGGTTVHHPISKADLRRSTQKRKERRTRPLRPLRPLIPLRPLRPLSIRTTASKNQWSSDV